MPNRNPLEALLDAIVYAPLGAALTLSEELPKLAEKGRAKLNPRLDTARVVGEFAVNQGRREAQRRFGVSRDHARSAPAAAGAEPTAEAPSDTIAAPSETPAPQGVDAEADVRLLAIPGYDSLSAPQVVQRLAGLSAEEREAVRAYEAAHRGRQTILARVAQLHEQQ